MLSCQIQVFKGHGGTITCMSTDLAGKILYTGSADASIKTWNIHNGQLIRVSMHWGKKVCIILIFSLHDIIVQVSA